MRLSRRLVVLSKDLTVCDVTLLKERMSLSMSISIEELTIRTSKLHGLILCCLSSCTLLRCRKERLRLILGRVATSIAPFFLFFSVFLSILLVFFFFVMFSVSLSFSLSFFIYLHPLSLSLSLSLSLPPSLYLL